MGRPRKNPKTVINVCEHCKKEYEVKYQKRTQRFCSKKCSNASPKTKQKIVSSQKKTFSENYGVDHPMKTKEVVKNFKKSMKTKYGVEHALQKKEFMEKSGKTKKERYGDETYNNPEKSKATCLERYGVENIRQSQEYLEKYYITCLEKYNTDHHSKSNQFKGSHSKLMFEKFENQERFENFYPLFSINEYKGVTKKFNRKYPFKCKRCDNESFYDISNGKELLCPTCDKKFSRFHTEVLEFLQLYETGWISNDRTQIGPLEIDIYSPTRNIGIVCNGMYWHSEVSGKKNKIYHLNKSKLSLIKGIRLIHIMDTEWILKQEIVKSMLLNIINKTPNKIYARKCTIGPVSSNIANDFLLKNHIQGGDRSSIKIGLFYKDELVSIMTFCKSRFDKKIEYEMSRYCNKINTTVIGGASKLFKHFIKAHNVKSIVSYSDRRFFTGNLYQTLGFSFENNTPPNYFYIIDNYLTVKNRINFQKHKLKEKLSLFDESLSEWENMKANGFDRIWDCGNSKWVYYS